MKKSIVYIVLLILPKFAVAQSGEEMLKKMYAAINSVENLSYVVHRVDTFLSGTVWNNKGYAILQKNRNDADFPFLLYGKRDDKFEFIFNGDDAIHIEHQDKTFDFIPSKHYQAFIGSPAGQMIMMEFLLPEMPFDNQRGYGYKEVTYEELNDRYIITLKYPDNALFDIKNQFKQFHINKQNFIPFYKYHFLETSIAERQVIEVTLTDIKINDPNIKVPEFDYELLATYKESDSFNPEFEKQLNNLLDKSAPELTLKNLQGERASLSDLRGKVVLLNFWEIWCGPCIESIPKINDFVNKYSQDDFVVWSIVSNEKTFDKLPAFVDRRNFNYPVFYGSKEDADKYYVRGVPEYIIIDKDGIVKFATVGFSKNIETELNKLLFK